MERRFSSRNRTQSVLLLPDVACKTPSHLLPDSMSGRPVVSVLEAGHPFRLWAFLSLDKVELDFVTFLEHSVPGRLNT
jgi:hypothetical protein